MSLYLRCGLPIIIWAKAGLASFVEKNNIGVCVSSLEELESIFSRMDIEDYMQMKKNALEIGRKLSQGFYFNKALQSACADLKVN